jgi:hypothetical protein
MSRIKELVHEDTFIIILDLINEEDILFGSFQSVLTQVPNIRRITANFVPCLLIDEQIRNGIGAVACSTIFGKGSSGPLLFHIFFFIEKQ